MQKGYKISFVLYSAMLLFSIYFMYMLIGASGHKLILKYYHCLIAAFALISILLLLLFPQISIKKNNLKFITGLSAIAFLTASLFLSLSSLFLLLRENPLSSFNIAALLFIGIFIVPIIYLIKQIILELKGYKKK